jgi:parallel beta-helix repeat protein
MNESVNTGNIIDGKNRRKAVLFAVTICALMLLSSFSVIGSALAAGPANIDAGSDASTPSSPISTNPADDQSQPSASDAGTDPVTGPDDAQTSDVTNTDSPVITDSNGNVLSASELKAMLDALKASGQSAKGLGPTPTVTITIQPNQPFLGTGKDSFIYEGAPGTNYGSWPIYMGNAGPGSFMRSAVEFDLSGYIGMGYESLLTSAVLSLFQTQGVPPTPGVAAAYPLLSPWIESEVTWNMRDNINPWAAPGASAPGVDYLPVPFPLVGTGVGSWATADIRPIVSAWMSTAIPNCGIIIDDAAAPPWTIFESSELPATGNPNLAPMLTMTFTAVQSKAGPLAASYMTYTLNNEFSVPYDALTVESNGLDHVNMYYRFSPDNGVTVPWTPWAVCSVIPGSGSGAISGSITFNASYGKGNYEFFTEAVTVDSSIEQDPMGADATTFFDLNGPFAPTNTKCWNNGMNANVKVSWDLSITPPAVTNYAIAWADDPKWIDFGGSNVSMPLLPNTADNALFLNQANDLKPDYYIVRSFDNAGIGYWSNNTNTVVNRDVFYNALKPATNNFAFVFQNMTVAASVLTITNSNLGFDWITVRAPADMTITSTDLVINGDLTILGDVVLNNVNLIMNGTYDGESMIYVAPGASLTVNGGTITNGAIDANYLFKVAGSLTLNNCNLSSCGSRNQTNLDEAGLFVTGSATLDTVAISDCYVGVLAGEGSTTVQVTDSTFLNCGAGALSYGSSALSVEDSVIQNCGGAMIQDGTLSSTAFSDDMESGTTGWNWNSQPIPLLIFDGESGEGAWTHGFSSGTDWWHLSDAPVASPFPSPTHGWSDANAAGTSYDVPATRIINWLTSPVIDTSGTTTPHLQFAEWFFTEGWYDRCCVRVSTDGGATWDSAWGPWGYVTGIQNYWSAVDLDISAYISATFRFQFYFDTTDGWVNNYPGWFIDDIQIVDTSAAGASWTQTTSEYNSATTSWTDSASGNYLDNNNLWLEHSVDLTTAQYATLDYYAMYSIASGDSFITEVSDNGGSSWTQLDSVDGTSAGYGAGTFTQFTYNLDAWAGSNIEIRFRMFSNGDATVDDGVYLDDVSVNIESPRQFLPGGGIGAFSNYAGTTDSDVNVLNNIILDTSNYALLTDTNSVMNWNVDALAVCSNSGPAALIDINGDITVAAPGQLIIDNTDATCWNVDVGIGSEMDVIDSAMNTEDVTASGVLYVENSDWVLPCTFDGEFGIDVTGEMDIVLGSSFGTTGVADFTFVVEPSAMFVMQSSELYYCGMPFVPSLKDSGLYIATDDALISSNYIHDCFVGVIADSVDIDIAYNTFEDNFIGILGYGAGSTGTLIDSNEIDGSLFGVYCVQGSSPTITGNDIHDNMDGIYGVSDSNPTILSNSIYFNTNGIELDNINISATVNNNDIYMNNGYGIWLSADNNFVAEINNNADYGNAYEGVYIDNAGANTAYLNMSLNAINSNGYNNGGSGVYVGTANNLVVNSILNIIEDNYNCGLELYATTDITLDILSNSIDANAGDGLYAYSSNGNIMADVTNNNMPNDSDSIMLIANSGSIVSPVIDNNYMPFSGDDGINMQAWIGISDASIVNNVVSACGSDGISLLSVIGDITGVVNSNSVDAEAADGIFVNSIFGNLNLDVVGNYAYGCGGNGIYLLSGSDIDGDVNGNIAYSSSTGYGIYIDASSDINVAVAGNEVYDSFINGIYIGAGSSVTADVLNNNAYECGESNIVIESGTDMDVDVSGNDAYTSYDGYGIYIAASNVITAVVVDNNDVDDSYLTGIYITASGSILAADVINNLAYECGESGIVVTSGNNIADVNVSGNTAYSAYDGNGIYIGAANGILASLWNNDVDDAYESGIYIESMSSITADVIDNDAYECGENGIVISSGDMIDANVSGNDAYTAYDGNGIYIGGANGVLASVQNNDVDNAYDSGIYIESMGSITVDVIDNLAYECGSDCIYISGDYVEANVSGNDADTSGLNGIHIVAVDILAIVQNNDVSDANIMGIALESLNSISADVSGNTADSSNNGCGVYIYSLGDVAATVQNNDVSSSDTCGVYVNSGNSVTADISDNIADNCYVGIMVGDIPFSPLYTVPAMAAFVSIDNNSADGCVYGIAVVAQTDISAYMDGDNANGNSGGGIAVVSQTGDIYLEASNCVADTSGMFGLLSMGDTVDATISSSEFESNNDGITIQANTYADVTIVQTDASFNSNGASIRVSSGDLVLTVDQSTFNGNGNSGLSAMVLASGDITASITNSVANANSNGNGIGLQIGGNGDITSYMDNVTAQSNMYNGIVMNAMGGQITADIANVYCDSNVLGNGLQLNANGYADISIDGGTSDSNGMGGIVITSATSGLDLYIASFESESNYNEGLFVACPGPINAMIDGIDASSNGFFSTTNGITMQSGSDITAEIDNSYLDDNWGNGLSISSGGIADLTAISTEFYDNGGNGVWMFGNSVDFSLDTCDADSNGWWSGGDGLWAASTTGTLTGTASWSSFDSNNNDGMYVTSPTDVDLDLSYLSLEWNYINGLNVASGGTVTLDMYWVDSEYNDWMSMNSGYGITVAGQYVSASMDTIWALYNGNDGIYITSTEDTTLDASNIITDSNYGDGMDVFANSYLTATIDTYEAIGNSNSGLSLVGRYDMSVDITDADIEGNTDDGIYLEQLNYGWAFDATLSSSLISSNGETGITAISPYWVNLDITGTPIAWNGWDAGDSAVQVNGQYATVHIDNSGAAFNYGDGVTISTTINSYVYISDSDFLLNDGEGLLITAGGYVDLGVTGPSRFNLNGENGIHVVNGWYISSDIFDSEINGNTLDGVNLDFVYNDDGTDFYNCDISNNGQQGIHITSDDWIGTQLDGNTIDSNGGNGVLLVAGNGIYANLYSASADQSITNNGGDGLSASAFTVDIDCDNAYIADNGGSGFDLSALESIWVDIAHSEIYDNTLDGLNADAGNDVYATAHSSTIWWNGGDGIDLNAPDELHLDADWTWSTDNGGDGINLVGAWYVDFNLMATNVISYNTGDGVEIVSSYCDFTAGSAGDVYFEHNGGSGATITTVFDPNLNINPDGVCSFSWNGAYGLYVSSGDNIDATLNSITADYNGMSGIYLGAVNWIGNMDNVHMRFIEAVGNNGDGAQLQSLNEDVNAEVYDSTFSWNGGDGLSMIAINGDVVSWVDNCYLDFNGDNGVYLYGQDVYLYPGTLPGVSNSYSYNQGDGIRMEGTNYVWLDVSLLSSSYNGGNGVTLIGPNGDIYLDTVSCDYNTNGIVVIGGIEGTIVSSETDNNANAGISVLGGHNLEIDQSEASYNTGVGMVLTNCDAMTLYENYLQYNGVGIIIDNTRDTVIVNNEVHYNFLDGIDVINGSDVTLINNIITFNFGWGIFSEPGVNIEWFADSSYDGEYAYAKMNDILLWGNITVEDNSLMTLEDLTTYIGTNQNLQRTIEIAGSGEMALNDATIQATGGYYYYFDVYGLLNTDFATIQDPWEVRAYSGSELNILRSNILDAGLYGVRAESGSFVNVLDSYFSGCGFSGMYIESQTVMVSGTTFETNYRGIWLVDVGPINIEDCSFIDNDRDGILVDGAWVTIPFCSFDGNGRGVRVDNDGLGLIDQCWFGSNDVGVDLLNSGMAFVTLSTFDDNDVGFYLDTWSYAWVENCTMNSLVQEFSERGDALAQTLNTPFSGPTYIIDNSELIVMWYLDVEVLDEAYDPIPGATVDVYENGPNWIGAWLTDSDGMASWIICVEYTKSNGVVDDSMNPHYIDVGDGMVSDSRYVTIDHTQTQTFVLNHPPVYVLFSMFDVTFDQGESYTYAFNLNDCFTDKGDLTFSWISWSPKIGVNVDSDGWVSFYGTDPDWSGSQWVTFRATDEDGLYIEHDVLLTIDRINTAPTITSTPVVGATQDVEYFYLVTATDPDIAYGDSLTYWLALCPSGMSIDSSTGLIDWVPAWNQVGINWVEVMVADMNGGVDSQLFAINVANVNDVPYFISTPSTSAVEGTLYSGQFTAGDQDLGYGDTLTFSLTTAPVGMIVDPVTGIVYWTPASNQVGNNLVVVKVTDLGGLYDIAMITIAVSNVNQAPTITSSPVTSATQGAQYYYQVTASDLDLPYGDTLTYTLTSAPAGMTIGGATGLISWIPAWNQIGLNWVTVRVTDSAAAFVSQQFAISVANVNDAPTISSTPATAATEGTQYSGTVVAADQDLAYGDVLTFSLTTYPTGMTINSATGMILWTPAYNQVGNNLVVVKVTDLGGLYATASMTMTVANVNQAPVITSTPVTSGTQGAQYYYQATATDQDIPVPGETLAYSLTAAPAGMTIVAATGLISWTPTATQIGLNWVTVTVTDNGAGLLSASQQFAIVVANVNDAPTITSTPSTAATEGTQYVGTVVAADQDLAYGDVLTFSLTTYPAGMTIDAATGTIRWTPAWNQVGNNAVVVRVTDIGGLYISASLTMVVTNVNQAPTITSMPVTVGTQGAQYYYQVTADDLDLNYGDTLTFSLSASPAGMTINPATGLVSWVPTAAQIGMNWVTVAVTDSSAATDSQQFAILVANVNDAPTITSTVKITAAAGVLYTYDVNATDLDIPFGDVLVYSLTTAAPGMTIDASTGLIQWMPNMHSPSPVTVIVQVMDSGGLSATQSYQITVSGINHAPSITGVTLSPADAVAGTTLNATADGWSDAESDAAQYLYQWYVNGNLISGANGAEFGGMFAKGDIVTAKITPYDGKEYGTTVESEGLVIGNTAPTLESASVMPLSPIKTDDLSVFVSGSNDVDAQDTVVFLYEWQYYNTTQNQWVFIPGANSDTLNLASMTALKVGDKVRCVVTPFDGTDSGTPVITNEVKIQEAPGAFPAAEIATIAGLAFATLFFLVLILYIIGKIGHKAVKKSDEDETSKEEPKAPEDK